MIVAKDFALHTGQMIRLDPPKDTRNALNWHQDSAYYPQNQSGQNGLVCWIPILPAKPENGTMQFLPGSHEEGEEGEGAISMDLWDRTVKILRDIDIKEIETHLSPLNISRQKMVHIMDSSNATYLHTNWETVTELLSKCGFTNFRRLTGATDTDFDLDVVESDPWGVEKFGSGDLRIACQKI